MMQAQTVLHEGDARVLGEPEEHDALEAYRLYSLEVSRYALLTSEQERTLAERAWQGDRQAREQLICANLRLVLGIVRDYRRDEPSGSYGMQDLIQVGNEGLLRAAKKFNPHLGNRFSTYATWWIRQAIGRYVAEESAAVHLPLYVVDEWRRLRRTELEFDEERLPEVLRSALPWLKRLTISLDAPVMAGDQETPLVDLLAEPVEEDDGPNPDLLVALEQALEQLPPRHRQVLLLRHWESLSYRQAAKVMSISAERVSQIEKAALGVLRRIMSQGGATGTEVSSSSLQVVEQHEVSSFVSLRVVARRLHCSTSTVRALAGRLSIVPTTLPATSPTPGRRETGYTEQEMERLAALHDVPARRRKLVAPE